MKKSIRKLVYNKFGGSCAYCGTDITFKQMTVDHVVPKRRSDTKEQVEAMGLEKGTDDIDNFFPACKSCNSTKSVYSVEKFRQRLIDDVVRLRRDSSKFRVLERFGIVKQIKTELEFNFEKYE